MQQRLNHYHSARGMTLIETGVVMLVIGIAMAMATPSLTKAMRSYRLNSGAQQVANAFQSAKFSAVRTNAAQSVFINTSTNATAVGATTSATATPLPTGVQFVTLPTSVTIPTIIANATPNAGTLSGQASNGRLAVSFGTVSGMTNFRQASFNSRGLPGPNISPGAVNWVYLTNEQNELMAITITSAGSIQTWRWNAATSQWS